MFEGLQQLNSPPMEVKNVYQATFAFDFSGNIEISHQQLGKKQSTSSGFALQRQQFEESISVTADSSGSSSISVARSSATKSLTNSTYFDTPICKSQSTNDLNHTEDSNRTEDYHASSSTVGDITEYNLGSTHAFADGREDDNVDHEVVVIKEFGVSQTNEVIRELRSDGDKGFEAGRAADSNVYLNQVETDTRYFDDDMEDDKDHTHADDDQVEQDEHDVMSFINGQHHSDFVTRYSEDQFISDIEDILPSSPGTVLALNPFLVKHDEIGSQRTSGYASYNSSIIFLIIAILLTRLTSAATSTKNKGIEKNILLLEICPCLDSIMN